MLQIYCNTPFYPDWLAVLFFSNSLIKLEMLCQKLSHCPAPLPWALLVAWHFAELNVKLKHHFLASDNNDRGKSNSGPVSLRLFVRDPDTNWGTRETL